MFLVFVLYPVGYGLWLARNPASYAKLVDDPIFARSVVNTLVFLIVGINIKMVVALFLSGFFVQARTWIKWLSLLFILPWARAVDPDHPVDPVHAESGVGHHQPRDLRAHGQRTGRTG